MSLIIDIYNDVKQLQSEIQLLKNDIQSIKSHLENISQSTQNMNEHISFVESVWTLAKNPFSHLLQFYYGKNENINQIHKIHDAHITNKVSDNKTNPSRISN